MPMRLAQSTAAILPTRDRCAMVGVPVLHVMADRAVMHDVIQLDRAVVPRAQVLLAPLPASPEAAARRSRSVVYASNGAGDR